MIHKLLHSSFLVFLMVSFSTAQNVQTNRLKATTPRSAIKALKTKLQQSTDKQDSYSSHEHSKERCIQHSITEHLMELSPEYRTGVESARRETARIMEELESGMRAAPPVYTIPIVFHVIHKGESVGSGTNISDAQILSAVDALNRDYRRTSADGGIAQGAGPDTEIQFCLASVDPSGNPTSGINRFDGSGVSGYSSNGITTGGGGNELSVKALSNWDNRYYLNIWVVSEIENNGADLTNPNFFSGGILGFAYLPTTNIQFIADRDGVVALNLCVGNDPNGSQGFRLWSAGLTNRTLTHEVGHFLGLAHPFSDSNPFSCTNGDGIGDTPNAQQANIFNCNTTTNCSGQMIENYMDYAPEFCQDRFTDGQNDVMRGTLAGVRNQLVNTNNCTVNSNDFDAGISAILSPIGALCSATFTPQVTLTNYGSTTLTSVQISYSIDGQPQTPFNWTGNLSSGSSISFTLPSATTTVGPHTFVASTVDGTLNNSNNDEDTSNDSSSSNFSVGTSGTQVILTLDLDCYGSETTWEIRNASNQVEYSGGPYSDNAPNGEQIIETFCLAEGCYDFNIFDSFNPPDGMSGAQYQGCDVDGDYTITEGSTVLVEMTAPNANFGGSATHNFCIGGGTGNPTTTCTELSEFYGDGFLVNSFDLPSFSAEIIDNDQEAVSTTLQNDGFTSNWMSFFEELSPGDTNFYVGVTSWHFDNTAPADNWLTFGPVTLPNAGGELRWKHRFANNNFRDGYEVLVGTSGTGIADFNNADVVYSIIDNDPSTNGDTTWTQLSADLPAASYANQSLYFAFHHRSIDQLFLSLDDIIVEGCEELITDLTEVPSDLTMNIFPNPSNGNFTLTYAVGRSEPINFELYNTMGQRVWSSISTTDSSGRLVIETSNMSRGVYTLVARNERYNSSKKLILSK